MYKYWLFALSLLLCVTPAAARDRASDRSTPSTTAAPEAAPPRTTMTDRYTGRGPSSARIPLVSNIDVGVGLYSVGGHFVRDRQTNGREPILGTSGRDNRVAAVGLSLRF